MGAMLNSKEKDALSATGQRFHRAMLRARSYKSFIVVKRTPQEKLIKALWKKETITMIWVENCQLNDMFLHAVAQYCPSLESLSLEFSTCNFTDDGMMAIGASAEDSQWQHGCPHLKSFSYNALSSYASGALTLLGIKAVLEGCREIKNFENTDQNVRYAPMLPIRSLFAGREIDVQKQMDEFAQWQESTRPLQSKYPVGAGNWMIHPRLMTGGVHTQEQAENVRQWLRRQYPNTGVGFLTDAQRTEMISDGGIMKF